MDVKHGSFTGSASAHTIYSPFPIKSIEFWAENAGGTAIEHGYKSNEMSGDAYLSTTTGTDAGVTIASDGLSAEVAGAADINVSGNVVYYEVRSA